MFKNLLPKEEKYFEDFCLLQQSFIKESSKKVSDIIKEIATDCGCGDDFKVVGFIRYALGENE